MGQSQPHQRWQLLPQSTVVPTTARIFVILHGRRDLVFERINRDGFELFQQWLKRDANIRTFEGKLVDNETKKLLWIWALQPDNGWSFNTLVAQFTTGKTYWRKVRTLAPKFVSFLDTIIPAPEFRCTERGCAQAPPPIQEYSEVASQAIAYIRRIGGIRSNIAAFCIVRAALSKKFSRLVTIERATAMWAGYREHLIKIDSFVERFTKMPGQEPPGNDPVLSHALFAVEALMLLKFPNNERVSVCPYKTPGQNFIIGLFTHECVCSCYAGFLAAAAEEVGREAWIVPTMFRGHVNVSILDRLNPVRASEALKVQQSGEGYSELSRRDPSALQFATEGDVFAPAIMVEAGFVANTQGFMLLVPKNDSRQTEWLLEHCRCNVTPWLNQTYDETFSRGNSWSTLAYCLARLFAGRHLKPLSENRMVLEITCIAKLFNISHLALVAATRTIARTTEPTHRFVRELLARTNELPWLEELAGLYLTNHAAVHVLPGGFLVDAQDLLASLRSDREYVDITPFACQRGLRISGSESVDVVVVPSKMKGAAFLRTFTGVDRSRCETSLVEGLLPTLTTKRLETQLKEGRAPPGFYILLHPASRGRSVLLIAEEMQESIPERMDLEDYAMVPLAEISPLLQSIDPQ